MVKLKIKKKKIVYNMNFARRRTRHPLESSQINVTGYFKLIVGFFFFLYLLTMIDPILNRRRTRHPLESSQINVTGYFKLTVGSFFLSLFINNDSSNTYLKVSP